MLFSIQSKYFNRNLTKFPGEEDIAFIDVAQNSMAKLPEKGILKKHGYGAVDGKDKWGDDSQSEQLEVGSQSDGQEPAGAVADMEYKFKVGLGILGCINVLFSHCLIPSEESFSLLTDSSCSMKC